MITVEQCHVISTAGLTENCCFVNIRLYYEQWSFDIVSDIDVLENNVAFNIFSITI